MKSSISALIKGRRSRGVSVNDWDPEEFVGATPEEAEELRMLSEGVTDREEWIGTADDSAMHAAGAGPHLRSPKDEVTAESLRGVVQTLIKKRQRHLDSITSVFFKAAEINAMDYVWPTLDMLTPPPPVEEVLEEVLPEFAPEPVVDFEAVNAEARQILDDARRTAETVAQDIQAEAQQEAAQRIQQAQNQSEEIVAAARSREAEITQQAFQQGMQAAQEQASLLLKSAEEIIRQAQAWHETMLTNSESELVSLLKAIARTLFGNGVALSPEMLREAVAQALQEAKPLGNLRIRIHPEDLEALGPLWAQQQTSILGVNVELSAAENLRRGGCIIEGDYGTLDGRVDARLERALEVIQQVETVHPEDQIALTQNGDGADSEEAGVILDSAEDLSTSFALEPETDDEFIATEGDGVTETDDGVAETDDGVAETDDGVIDLSAGLDDDSNAGGEQA